jgi:hypothetical protein
MEFDDNAESSESGATLSDIGEPCEMCNGTGLLVGEAGLSSDTETRLDVGSCPNCGDSFPQLDVRF